MHFHIVYASTSGNVEAVVEKIKAVLAESGIETTLFRAEKTTWDQVNAGQDYIFATSTWEHGELNPFFQKLLAEMRTQDFQGKRAAFVGLGDTRYEPVLFCHGMEKVRDVWMKNNGAEIIDRLKINGEPYHLLDCTVTDWAKKLSAAIMEK